ncbi:MAG: hypothetical protein WB714_24285, partial [Candidatus Sulfotelmatobacter sp.]
MDQNARLLDGKPVVKEPYALATARWDHRSTVLLLCVLASAMVVTLRGVRLGEFSYNVDETQHAVTGLYVADLVRDHPFA